MSPGTSAASATPITPSGASGGRLNLRERLKKKMQNLLNKQCKRLYRKIPILSSIPMIYRKNI